MDTEVSAKYFAYNSQERRKSAYKYVPPLKIICSVDILFVSSKSLGIFGHYYVL